MTDEQIATQVRGAVAVLSAAIEKAAAAGITVDVDVVRVEALGQRYYDLVQVELSRVERL